jgi:hypothetical protein
MWTTGPLLIFPRRSVGPPIQTGYWGAVAAVLWNCRPVTLLDRIERATGVPGLATLLGDLPQADLRSLLLEVNRRQAKKLTPAQVFKQYRRDRFTGPAQADPGRLAEFDLNAFEVLRAKGYTPIELAPVSPLGTVSVLSPLNQNLVLTTERGTEVTADATNALALESAARRTGNNRVRLCASHRLLRTQPFPEGWSQHFRLLALTVAGRDEGSFRFETESLHDQLAAMLSVLGDKDLTVAVTDLGNRRDLLANRVLEPLKDTFPQVNVIFDDERQKGRGYYVDACFDLRVNGVSVADGGFTTWTRQLRGDAKERLLTGGLGIEMLFGADPYP